jgi:hypothetical protein
MVFLAVPKEEDVEALAAARSCPECADWPAEIGIRIVEIVVEPGQPVPEPDQRERHPAKYGPCPCCSRVHRATVVAITSMATPTACGKSAPRAEEAKHVLNVSALSLGP